MTEPYLYIITHYPSVKVPGIQAKILYSGNFIADSQESAFRQMLELMNTGYTADKYDPEEVEFIAKPVLDEYTYAKKKAQAMNLYNSYFNKTWDSVNSTSVWFDSGFQSMMPDKPSLPKAMMMIDVIALVNDDKKL